MPEKVCIYILNAHKAEDAAKYLKQGISETGTEITVKEYEDSEKLASDLLKAKGKAVAACPLEDFSGAKLDLVQTLSKKLSKSAAVIAALGDNAPENQTEYNIQTAIPENGKAFPTADGMYSGFSFPVENGTAFFIPLDSVKTTEVLESGMLSAIHKSEKEKRSSAVENFKEHIEGIIGNGKTIGVAAGGSSKALLSAVSTVPGWDKVFRAGFSEIQPEDGETEENYSARCAKEAKEACEADLGISISGVCEDGENGSFVAVSVADSERAKGAKVFAKGGEDKKHLISAAVIRLCEMLDEFSGNGIPVPEEKLKSKSHTPLLIILTGILIAMVVCAAIAISSFASRDKLSNNAVLAMEHIEETDPRGGVGLDDGGNEIIPLDETTAPAQTSVSTSVLTTVIKTTVKATTAVTTKLAAIATTVKDVVTTTAPTTAAATAASTAAPSTAVTAASTAEIKTTVKPSEAETTQKSDSTSSTTKNFSGNSSGGKWVFKAYGWGHAVGMSQQGAITMAKSGSTYDEILMNYYNGTSIKTDSNTPKAITYGGKSIPIVEYLCRTACAEIGDDAPLEALKAQIVCAYTFAKYYGFNVDSSKHAYRTSFNYPGTKMHTACLSVLGMSSDADTPKAKYVDYGGKAAFTCYFDCCAGKTTSAESVWGGSGYPYLKGGNISPEKVEVSTVEITVDQMRKYIESYAKDNDKTITLGPDPESWLEILSHDSAYNSTTGYVEFIRIGDIKVRGNAFRCYVVDFKLRSHCFSMEFVK